MAILNSYVSLPEGKVLQLTTTNVFGYLWMWVLMGSPSCGVSHVAMVTDPPNSPRFRNPWLPSIIPDGLVLELEELHIFVCPKIGLPQTPLIVTTTRACSPKPTASYQFANHLTN